MAEPVAEPTAADDDDREIQAVLGFWFVENGPKQWFTKDAAFDDAIRRRFGALHARAAEKGLPRWRATAPGALAEIIVLDQFSRNLYRDDARAFACDGLALAAAREAVEKGIEGALTEDQRLFLYLPFEHSENARDQETSVALQAQLSDPEYLDWARKHKAVIDRFGRYPHRNALLGRESTEDEKAFLEEEGSSF